MYYIWKRLVLWAIISFLAHMAPVVPHGPPEFWSALAEWTHVPKEFTSHEWFDMIVPVIVTSNTFYFYNIYSVSWSAVWIILASVILAQGHGIHMTANALDRMFTSTEPTPHYSLNYFLDEHLGHHTWFIGEGLLILILILAEKSDAQRYEKRRKPNDRNIIEINSFKATFLQFFAWGLAIFQGICWWASSVEGQTVVLCGTLLCLIMGLIFLNGNQRLGGIHRWMRPTNARREYVPYFHQFMVVSAVVGVACMGLYGHYCGWDFPELHVVMGQGQFRQWRRRVMESITGIL